MTDSLEQVLVPTTIGNVRMQFWTNETGGGQREGDFSQVYTERAGGVRDALDSTAKRGGILGSFKRCAELLAYTRRISDQKTWKTLFDEVVHEKLHRVPLAVFPVPAALGATHLRANGTGATTMGGHGSGSHGLQRNPAQILHENSSVLRNLLQPHDSQLQTAARIDTLGGLASSGSYSSAETPARTEEDQAMRRHAATTSDGGSGMDSAAMSCTIKSETASAAAVVNAMNADLPLQSTLSDPRQKADQSFQADLLQIGLEGTHSKPLPDSELLRGLIDDVL